MACIRLSVVVVVAMLPQTPASAAEWLLSSTLALFAPALFVCLSCSLRRVIQFHPVALWRPFVVHDCVDVRSHLDRWIAPILIWHLAEV
jgi:hypothetical protein